MASDASHAIGALAAFGCWCWYRRWLRRRTKIASSDSAIVATALGQVEYGVRGDGPVVLHFDGDPTSGDHRRDSRPPDRSVVMPRARRTDGRLGRG